MRWPVFTYMSAVPAKGTYVIVFRGKYCDLAVFYINRCRLHIRDIIPTIINGLVTLFHFKFSLIIFLIKHVYFLIIFGIMKISNRHRPVNGFSCYS
jgi:hypothetical protein